MLFLGHFGTLVAMRSYSRHGQTKSLPTTGLRSVTFLESFPLRVWARPAQLLPAHPSGTRNLFPPIQI